MGTWNIWDITAPLGIRSSILTVRLEPIKTLSKEKGDDMILITVIFKGHGQLAQFNFDDPAEAEVALDAYRFSDAGGFEIRDDYGCAGCFAAAEVAGVILTDLDKEMEAAEKNELTRIKKDIAVRKKLQADPGARLLMPQGGMQ